MKKTKLYTLMSKDWADSLYPYFQTESFQILSNRIAKDRKTRPVYPDKENIFRVFRETSLSEVKVVIIGQDPYHGPNQANGLCFSVRKGINHPPSLKNIFKEIKSDLNVPYPNSGDLSAWSKQGVLLLNATLTVRAHQAGSHQQLGWEKFTDAAINAISIHKKNVVFLLWGGFAKKKAKLIDATNHKILTSGHPSPLSANRGLWFGNNHFSLTNEYLSSIGHKTIDWSLDK